MISNQLKITDFEWGTCRYLWLLCKMSSPIIPQRSCKTARTPVRKHTPVCKHTPVGKRSVAAELVRIVRRVAAMDGFQFDQFLTYLNNYQLARTQLLSSKHNGAAKVQDLDLHCSILRICLKSFQSQSVESLCFDLESLFSQHRQIPTQFGNPQH